jgi:predicted hotdog family 3-hydroxylacyl-ACP dehydratase
MLLIDSVEEVTARSGTGRVRLDPKAWYADATGRTPAWIGLELMAQTVAACRGQHLARTGGAPRGGYLVGTRSYRSAVPAFEPSASLDVKIVLVEEDPSGLCSFHCEILHLGRPLAEATLKVMIR